MDIPDDYRGREQSYLKHRVLQEYLSAWGHKLGSLARRRAVKLWYIDCFAGPWKNQHEELRDTSIDIGLRALEQAASTWEAAGYQVETGAIFVEKSRVAYQRLRRYLHGRSGQVDVRALHGEFGQHVGEIARIIGDDPAFVFIDPTGFKGVNMAFIARLAQARMRDVMVNVMFNHINRWKDDPREFLRTQMKDFFGLTDASLASRHFVHSGPRSCRNCT